MQSRSVARVADPGECFWSSSAALRFEEEDYTIRCLRFAPFGTRTAVCKGHVDHRIPNYLSMSQRPDLYGFRTSRSGTFFEAIGRTPSRWQPAPLWDPRRRKIRKSLPVLHSPQVQGAAQAPTGPKGCRSSYSRQIISDYILSGTLHTHIEVAGTVRLRCGGFICEGAAVTDARVPR
jgi:hypothetical protein